MKTTFSRLLFTTLVLLLAALVLVGTSLRLLVNNYLTDTAVESLESDAQVISELASVYGSDGNLVNINFLLNLNVMPGAVWFSVPIPPQAVPIRACM